MGALSFLTEASVVVNGAEQDIEMYWGGSVRLTILFSC
jgi:hypothetical protein